VAWTIEQLVAECARILAGEEQPSGRVTDAPDLRTIRYYASLGLLDPPSGFEKKKGLYDERHLLQLLAIKRLQRGGLALADIQSQLAGATDARLRTLSQFDAAPPARPAPPPASERFWARKPRALPAVEAFRVAPGITLIADGTKRPLTEDDLRALRAWLAARGLTEEQA
jgi:DNA-binding transcriptional MerR regulator